jgi:DNA-binding NarL/FixJ family response regulator
MPKRRPGTDDEPPAENVIAQLQRLRDEAVARRRRAYYDDVPEPPERRRVEWRKAIARSVIATIRERDALGFDALQARRARIAQAMIEGRSVAAIAVDCGVSRQTVYKDWERWQQMQAEEAAADRG